MKCQKCGEKLQDGVLFCKECGTKVEKIENRKRFCIECGNELTYGEKFCHNCLSNANIYPDVSVDTSSGKSAITEETVVVDDNTSGATAPTKKL